MKTEKCNNCNNIYFDYLITCEKYNLLKCKNCELLLTYPQPTEKELLNYYSKSYFNHWFSYPKVKEKTDTWRYKLIKNHIRNHIRKHIKHSKIKLLDFGAGIGNFLKIIKEKEPRWYLLGIEFSEYAKNYSQKNYDITLYDLTELQKQNIKFDVITLWHTIEHLTDPDFIIKEIYKLLNPNGLLFIETPNTNSILTKIRGLKSLNLIEHLFHYTPETLEYLFLKNNFKILLNRPGNPGYTRTGIKIFIKKILSQTGKFFFRYSGKNYDDTMLFILRKNNK